MNLIKADMTQSKIIVGPFTQKILLDGSPTIHPLSENNGFIVALGLLAGTLFSNPYRNNQ